MYPSELKKKQQLGMDAGAASLQLKKSILFFLAQKCGMDICFQCGKKIEYINEFTVEHKTPYLNSADPLDLYFDMDNIAFSHGLCNTKARRASKPITHGTQHAYITRGCRCAMCVDNWRAYRKSYMANSRKKKWEDI